MTDKTKTDGFYIGSDLPDLVELLSNVHLATGRPSHRSQNGCEDGDVLGAAGLPAHEAAGAVPKLDAFIAIIERILAEDKSRPKKQQHTAKRIFERLRDEHGFAGGITIVKDYVAGCRQRAQEMFVPLVQRHVPLVPR